MQQENRFDKVPALNIQRSSFKQDHALQTTFDADYLVPIFWNEVLPGSTHNLSMNGFARMNTPIHPIMSNIHMETFFFFIPTRIIQDNWKKLQGEQIDPADSIAFTAPTITSPGGGYTEQSLYDYFGIPTKIASLEHNSYLMRAYNKIWNFWFRDQNLQDSVVVDLDDGPDTSTDYALLKRGKKHDYFTSCLPWPQKQTTDITLPLGTSAPLVGTIAAAGDGTNPPVFQHGSASNLRLRSDGSTDTNWSATSAGATDMYWSDPQINVDLSTGTADLSSADGATINAFRLSLATQELLEIDARSGTRYPEILMAHFGVSVPNVPYEPIYLGGGHSFVNVHPVAQTSSTDATTPQGNLSAIGTANLDGHGFNASFEEHGYLVGLVNVRGDLGYQEGLERMFSRSTRYDFYLPVFAHLGEQAVLNKEIYADASANDDNVFGYQEHWSEYRYKQSRVTGKFRSNTTGSLDPWHIIPELGSLPTLNNTYIQSSTPMDRVVAVTTEPDFNFDAYFNYTVVQPMPMYSIPGLGNRL